MKRYIFLVGFVVSLIGAARADDRAEAKKHFKTGLTLLKAEDFDAAAVELELSVELYANQNNLFNLANCYWALHRYGEALDLFERVLKEFDAKLDREMRKDIKAQIKEINDLIARLTVVVNQGGATITVDGKEVGTSPLAEPLILAPGKYQLEVSLDGYDPVSRTLTLISGTETAEQFELETAAPSPEETAAEASSEDTSEETLLDATPAEPSGSAEDGRRLNPVFWSGLAGAVVFAGVSGAMWGLTAKKVGDYDDKNQRLKDEWTRELRDDAYQDGEDAKKRNKIAVGMTVATGLFAALMVVGLVVDFGDEKPDDTAAVAVSPTTGGVRVRF